MNFLIISNSTRCIIIAIFCLLICSCAAVQIPDEPALPNDPISFNEAIQALVKHLLYNIQKDEHAPKNRQIVVIIEPFKESISGEVLRLSLSIEKMTIEAGSQTDLNYKIVRLTSDTITDADYIIDGVIGLDRYKSDSDEKHYHVSAIIGNIKQGKIIGYSEVWIEEKDIDSAPLMIYRDSPLFDTGQDKVKMNIRTIASQKEYFKAINNRAILTDARTAYESQNYQKAFELYTYAAEHMPNPGLIVYTGLYLVNSKLGKMDDAEKAFQKLIALSVEQYKSLTVRFLFEVNSVKFIGNFKEKYDMWVRHIARYFSNTSFCIEIEGHSSCTGSESWNTELSLKRAQTIQHMMQPHFSDVLKRSKAVGRGSLENVIGTCSDDDRDSLDRRVEIHLTDCSQL